jgi:hypothetical protein
VTHHSHDSCTDSLCRFACPLHRALDWTLHTTLLHLLSSLLGVFTLESVFLIAEVEMEISLPLVWLSADDVSLQYSVSHTVYS